MTCLEGRTSHDRGQLLSFSSPLDCGVPGKLGTSRYRLYPLQRLVLPEKWERMLRFARDRDMIHLGDSGHLHPQGPAGSGDEDERRYFFNGTTALWLMGCCDDRIINSCIDPAAT